MPWLEGTKSVRMSKIRQGDYLTGLDNAYVFDTEADQHGMVTLTMHDREGNEMTLEASRDVRVTVRLPRERM